MQISPEEVGKAVLKAFKDLFNGDDHEVVHYMYNLVDKYAKKVDNQRTAFIFGSFAVFGIHERDSDADFSILQRGQVKDFKWKDGVSKISRKRQMRLLSKIAVFPEGNAQWEVEKVFTARVPVLRVNGQDGVKFDVIANRRDGMRNSALLRAYFNQAPHFRLLGLAVKKWSKECGLNSSGPKKTLSSFGFNIMTAYYLLRRKKVTFVPISSINMSKMDPLPPHLPLERPKDDGLELGKEVIDFLNFYLHEFDATTQVISLNREGITTKSMLRWTKDAEDRARMNGEKVHYQWCIEDPFTVDSNVGRNVTEDEVQSIHKHLKKTLSTAFLNEI